MAEPPPCTCALGPWEAVLDHLHAQCQARLYGLSGTGSLRPPVAPERLRYGAAVDAVFRIASGGSAQPTALAPGAFRRPPPPPAAAGPTGPTGPARRPSATPRPRPPAAAAPPPAVDAAEPWLRWSLPDWLQRETGDRGPFFRHVVTRLLARLPAARRAAVERTLQRWHHHCRTREPVPALDARFRDTLAAARRGGGVDAAQLAHDIQLHESHRPPEERIARHREAQRRPGRSARCLSSLDQPSLDQPSDERPAPQRPAPLRPATFLPATFPPAPRYRPTRRIQPRALSTRDIVPNGMAPSSTSKVGRCRSRGAEPGLCVPSRA